MAHAAAAPRLQRLFVGLWPDEAVRDEIAAHARGWSWPPQARPTRRERLHLTLCFLGDVPGGRVPGLLRRLALDFEPFELRLGRPELWSGGTAVLCPIDPPPALQALHRRLQFALSGAGAPWAPRRLELRPHVTLARGVHAALPPRHALPIAWAVSAYTLIESDLTPPARYRVLHEYP